MSADQTRNVAVTAELHAFVRAPGASGTDRNASEAVRAGLRPLQGQHERDGRKKDVQPPREPHARPR